MEKKFNVLFWVKTQRVVYVPKKHKWSRKTMSEMIENILFLTMSEMIENILFLIQQTIPL